MAISFNSILLEAGLVPANVRLLRHKDHRATKGRTPYELWRDFRPQFEVYQSTQGIKYEARLNAAFWAAFLVTPNSETMFVGLYAVGPKRLLDQDQPRPHTEGVDAAGTCHRYELALDDRLSDLVGRMIIDWGPGERAWVQRADQQNKEIRELRRCFYEPEFPGFLNFITPLSQLHSLPATWIAALRTSRGVYLLTCPKTKEQYVGSATGEEAFWHRWQQYVQTGHGGNVVLKSRDPSDYQVSILEVAGSAATSNEIIQMEQLWKAKLQSREMGLNRN